MLVAQQHPPGPVPTFRRMVWDMEALACMMMVAVLSSRISLRSGVGSLASSSIRTEVHAQLCDQGMISFVISA